MKIIDADAHVDETDATWDFLEPEHAKLRPITAVAVEDAASAGIAKNFLRYWNIDGRMRLRRMRDDVRTGTTEATRELKDVPARLRQMDELGVDVQVLYPTTMLSAVSEKPEVELALCRSYNRWIASRCAESDGRLRWVASMPVLSIDAAVEEMAWAKENGAAGAIKRGVEAGQRSAGDPYFYPLYRQAEELDMAMCIHIGAGEVTEGMTNPIWQHRLPPIDAFVSLVLERVPEKFPRLRVGFVEAMSSWVPFALAELEARKERMAWFTDVHLREDLLRECRFYVACQTHEDLNYIASRAGSDNLVIGTDYGHADQSAEINALSILREKGEREEIPATLAEKVLTANPAALYGID